MPKRADPGPAPTHFVTNDEKKWMRLRIEQLKPTGYGIRQLAKACKVSRQAMYQLIDGETRNVTYWPTILKALGGEDGSVSVQDARLDEIIRRWPELSEDDRALVEATARRLSRKP